MQFTNDEVLTPPSPGQREDPTTIFCRLFNDRVTDALCLLRKRELDKRGEFSCGDCDSGPAY